MATDSGPAWVLLLRSQRPPGTSTRSSECAIDEVFRSLLVAHSSIFPAPPTPPPADHVACRSKMTGVAIAQVWISRRREGAGTLGGVNPTLALDSLCLLNFYIPSNMKLAASACVQVYSRVVLRVVEGGRKYGQADCWSPSPWLFLRETTFQRSTPAFIPATHGCSGTHVALDVEAQTALLRKRGRLGHCASAIAR